MKVYSYCSYKGALKGYQYAKFDLDKEGEEKSLSIEEMKGQVGYLPQEVKEWFEFKSGWKLALIKKQNNPSDCILFLGKIEEARRIQKRNELEKIENNKSSNRYRKKEVKYESVNLNQMDSGFFINLAFEGSIQELRFLAAGVINEFQGDGGIELLNCFEKAYIDTFKTLDRTRYYVKISEIRHSINTIENRLKEDGVLDEKPVAHKKSFSLVKCLWSKCVVTPYIQLESGSRVFGKSERRKNVNELINVLISKKEFSENLILYISDGSRINEYGTANLAAELEYLL